MERKDAREAILSEKGKYILQSLPHSTPTALPTLSPF